MKPTYDEVIEEVAKKMAINEAMGNQLDCDMASALKLTFCDWKEYIPIANSALRALQDMMPDISICDEGVTKYYNLHDAFNKYNHFKTLGRDETNN